MSEHRDSECRPDCWAVVSVPEACPLRASGTSRSTSSGELRRGQTHAEAVEREPRCQREGARVPGDDHGESGDADDFEGQPDPYHD